MCSKYEPQSVWWMWSIPKCINSIRPEWNSINFKKKLVYTPKLYSIPLFIPLSICKFKFNLLKLLYNLIILYCTIICDNLFHFFLHNDIYYLHCIFAVLIYACIATLMHLTWLNKRLLTYSLKWCRNNVSMMPVETVSEVSLEHPCK